MSIMMWVLAGGAIGWAAFAVYGFNENRGRNMSIVIGAAGGFLGGNVLAPMLSGPAVPEVFSVLALLIAAMSAAACLTIGNMVYNRFGV